MLGASSGWRRRSAAFRASRSVPDSTYEGPKRCSQGTSSNSSTQRPWQGQLEAADAIVQPAYDPDCYLCPGNARAGGVCNPDYLSTFVFENDFAALKPATPAERFECGGLLVAEGEPGVCRVVCFSPQHNLTVANMELRDLRVVVDTWVEQFAELGSLTYI